MVVRIIINTMSVPKRKGAEDKENKGKIMKTIFLQLQDNFMRPSYPNSMPQKKQKQYTHRHSLRNVAPEGEGQSTNMENHKAGTARSNSVQIDVEGLRQIAARNRSNSQKKEDLGNNAGESTYSSKIQYKVNKTFSQYRSKTGYSQNNPQKSEQPSKKLANILFRPSLQFQSSCSRQILKSPNIFLRTTSGKKQKLDGLMYLHKIKIKCLNRQRKMSLVQGQAFKPNQTQREVIKNKDRTNVNKQYYLSTYTNFGQKKKAKRITTDQGEQLRRHQVNQCRPWSGRDSVRSDHHLQ